MVEPLANAGASLSIEMNRGTFHGTMPALTPTGSWRTRAGPIMPGRTSSNSKLRVSLAK